MGDFEVDRALPGLALIAGLADRVALLAHAFDHCLHLQPALRAEHAGRVVTDDLRHRAPHQPRQAFVDEAVAAVFADHRDVAGETLQHRALFRCGGFARFDGAHLGGDVSLAPHAQPPAGAQRHRRVATQQHAPVAQAHLILRRCGAGNDGVHAPVLGVGVALPGPDAFGDLAQGRRGPPVRRKAIQAEQLLVGKANRLVGAGGVGGENRVAGGVERAAQVFGAGDQRFAGLFLLGDVARDDDHATPVRRAVGKREVGRLHEAQAVAAQVDPGADHGGATSVDGVADGLAPGGRDHARGHRPRGAAQRLFTRVAGATAPGVVDHAVDLLVVDHADHVGGGVHHHLVHVQRVLGLEVGRQVGPDAHRTDDAALRVGDRRGGVQAVDARAIGPGQADGVAAALSLTAGSHLALHAQAVLTIDEVECAAADHVAARPAEQLGHRRVQVGGDAVQVDEPEALRGVLQHAVEQPGLVGVCRCWARGRARGGVGLEGDRHGGSRGDGRRSAGEAAGRGSNHTARGGYAT